jgi:hypothetical protein
MKWSGLQENDLCRAWLGGGEAAPGKELVRGYESILPFRTLMRCPYR